ncbi:MAG: hypothetical protein HW421_3647 [Ignavibacteria bacterium]|nr:hypothetical protein [Ignavibacteria bacterium]
MMGFSIKGFVISIPTFKTFKKDKKNVIQNEVKNPEAALELDSSLRS